ncbi:hypothetical protein HAX54_046371 [Datura stramonium]|uniref:Uncharacterized protein n=1 Tax=Datura stramonium TaxID=4076 RepID=A0ABS8SRG6_DATST|nr:hypothetical protein [Datura stramonium]
MRSEFAATKDASLQRGVLVLGARCFKIALTCNDPEWGNNRIGSYWLWKTAAVVGFPLQRDRHDGRILAVTDLENNHWIRRSDVLITIAGPLQRTTEIRK